MGQKRDQRETAYSSERREQDSLFLGAMTGEALCREPLPSAWPTAGAFPRGGWWDFGCSWHHPQGRLDVPGSWARLPWKQRRPGFWAWGWVEHCFHPGGKGKTLLVGVSGFLSQGVGGGGHSLWFGCWNGIRCYSLSEHV